jgi:hypothetical protein
MLRRPEMAGPTGDPPEGMLPRSGEETTDYISETALCKNQKAAIAPIP